MTEEYYDEKNFKWSKWTGDGYACVSGVAISGDKFAAAQGRCRGEDWAEENPKWSVKIYDLNGNARLTLRNSKKNKNLKFIRDVYDEDEEKIVTREWTAGYGVPLGEDSNRFLGQINSIAMDGNLVVAGGVENVVYLWDISKVSDKNHVEPVHILEGHKDKVNTVALMGDTIVSGSSDRTVKVWNTNGILIESIDVGEGVSNVGMNKDIIAAAAGRGDLHVINRTGMSLKTIDLKNVAGLAVGDNIIATTPDDDKEVHIRKLDGSVIRTLALHSKDRCRGCNDPDAQHLAIDGDRIVVGSHWDYGKTLTVWNITTGELLSEMNGSSEINSVDICHGNIVASGVGGQSDKIYILKRRGGAGGLQRSSSGLKSYPKLKY